MALTPPPRPQCPCAARPRRPHRPHAEGRCPNNDGSLVFQRSKGTELRGQGAAQCVASKVPAARVDVWEGGMDDSVSSRRVCVLHIPKGCWL